MNILESFDTESISERGAWCHLTVPGSGSGAYLDPETMEKPLRINTKGPDSDVWTRFVRKATKSQDKDEDSSLHDAKLLARMTITWENIPDENGEPMPFSLENAIKVYLKYKDIRVQLLRFIVRQENFTQAQQQD